MTPGVALIAVSSLVAMGLVVWWRRMPLAVALSAMAVAAAGLGAGALLVQEDVSAAEWIVTLAVFATIVPLEAHLTRSDRGGSVAEDRSDA